MDQTLCITLETCGWRDLDGTAVPPHRRISRKRALAGIRVPLVSARALTEELRLRAAIQRVVHRGENLVHRNLPVVVRIAEMMDTLEYGLQRLPPDAKAPSPNNVAEDFLDGHGLPRGRIA